MFGAKRRRAREIAHEVLRPLGIETTHLTEHSRQNFEADMLRVVKMGQDDELYRRQEGWKRDEAHDDVTAHSMKRMGR